MDGEQRRTLIVELLNTETEPLSGTALARRLGVSRQVIVQDIALLRATNKNILSTNKGYIIYGKQDGNLTCKRVFAVKHTDEEMREELYCIVDAGAKVLDVIIEHDVYGQIAVDLFINSRRDVDEFMDRILGDQVKPLKELTGDVHFHTVEAEREEILDLVEAKLKEKQYLI
ncbi:MAG: transcription repressor NadR [Eubacteriales bacterium]|nr:transcription repressor NadR [Eubacteriales bacterium]